MSGPVTLSTACGFVPDFAYTVTSGLYTQLGIHPGDIVLGRFGYEPGQKYHLVKADGRLHICWHSSSTGAMKDYANAETLPEAAEIVGHIVSVTHRMERPPAGSHIQRPRQTVPAQSIYRQDITDEELLSHANIRRVRQEWQAGRPRRSHMEREAEREDTSYPTEY